VINPKHVAFVHQLREEPIQRRRAGEVLSKRFLENYLAVSREPRAVQCRDRGGEDDRGQCEIDRDGVLTGNAGRNIRLIGEIESLIPRRSHEGRYRAGVDAAGLALKPAGGPVAELLVVPVLTAGTHELEPLGEVSAGLEGGQARKQVAACQVARATEYDKPIDHLRSSSARCRRLAIHRVSWQA